MYIADLHIHSKYSRATSRDCVTESLDFWARRKGIKLIGTGDFTHPAWREELYEKLVPAEDGLYQLREEYMLHDDAKLQAEATRFVISGEISSIYKKGDKVRKVHNLILLPSLDAAENLSRRLEKIGNIHSDGRPILGLDSRDLLEITLESCPEAIFIPAHIWTPHFSMFGSFSHFSTVEECFEDLTPYIHAMETGLSSDPPMNWRVSQLDRFQLISNSDAHSPAKLGREANLLDTDLSYPALSRAIQTGEGLAGTIEFFPEEGKYHYDGHRNCNLCLKPEQTIAYGGRCPVCGKKLTIGVDHRITDLADRKEGVRPSGAKPFESLVPLPEVIAGSTGLSAASKKTAAQYEDMLQKIGNEFYILREAPIEAISTAAGPCIAEGIRRLRIGQVERTPGYDGEYGTIRLLSQTEIDTFSGQFSLFEGLFVPKSTESSKPVAAMPAAEEKTKQQTGIFLPNPEQEAAMKAVEPAVAVIAGPGTGKTKTLISRIIHLIQNRGVKPSQITAVTFTNKAAEEMRARLLKEFGERSALRGITIGTFHAVCLDLLTKEKPQLTLIDEYRAADLAQEAIAQSRTKFQPKQFLQQVSAYKNGVAANRDDSFTETFRFYQSLLEQNNLLDFDDLLIQTQLLCQNKPKQERCFDYLLVDEYQDINPLQYQLLQIWGKNSKGLFVIGDPDQSIYGFRGADAKCFEKLQQDYPALRQIRLVQNYRSTPQILDCALPMISKNSGEKRVLQPNRSDGAAVDLMTAQTPLSEGIFIAKEINRMVGGLDMLDSENHLLQIKETISCGFSDIAVLYRTHHQSKLLETCLKKENIPYVVVGRDDFLTDPSVRGILSFFQTLLMPSDTIALSCCLKSLWNCPKDLIEGFSKAWRTVSEQGENILNGYRSIGYLQEFFRLAVKFRSKWQGKPVKVLENFLKEADLPETEATRKLLNTAAFYKTLPEMLACIAGGEENSIVRGNQKSYAAGAVTLMTLHAAKGLEYPVVFLAGVTQGNIPLESERHPADPEEERRLFYVGMTRAKDKLYLLSSEKAPSPFLSDIPNELLKGTPVIEKKTTSDGVQLSLF